MRNTLAIVGSFPDTRGEYDFARQDCDVWVFNEAMSSKWALRADAVFQMHAEPIWRNPQNRNDKEHYAWLASGNTPLIYMQAHYNDVPRSVAYPFEDVTRALLGGMTLTTSGVSKAMQYFTSSVSYALALGIFKGYRKIEIYGVEMASDTEYRYQRDGVAFWIGLAAGRGIKIDFHGKIFDAPLYGYEGEVALNYDVFVGRLTALTPQAEAAQRLYEQAKEKFRQEIVKFLAGASDYDAVSVAAQEQLRTAQEFGVIDGARQENERYKGKADAMKQASGGEFIFSRQEFESSGQAIFKERNKALLLAQQFAGRCEVLLRTVAAAKNKTLMRTRYKEFAETYNEYIRIGTAVGMYTGALNENAQFLKILDEYIKAAGGSKSEAVLLEALR